LSTLRDEDIGQLLPQNWKERMAYLNKNTPWKQQWEPVLREKARIIIHELEVLLRVENSGRGSRHSDLCVQSQLLGRQRLGGSQFEAGQGKKLARPHLNK
jgi:hypothetical protein